MNFSPGEVVSAVIIACGGLSAIAYAIFRGFWSQKAEPLVKKEIEDFVKTTGTLEPTMLLFLQKPETKALIKAEFITLQTDTVYTNIRKEEIKSVIDDQVRRDDGIIHKELSLKIKEQNDMFKTKFDEMLDIQRKQAHELSSVALSTNRLEGMVTVLLRDKRTSSSDHHVAVTESHSNKNAE